MNPVPAICDRRPAGQQEKVFQHAVSESNMTIVSFDTIISEPPYTVFRCFWCYHQKQKMLKGLLVRFTRYAVTYTEVPLDFCVRK